MMALTIFMRVERNTTSVLYQISKIRDKKCKSFCNCSLHKHEDTLLFIIQIGCNNNNNILLWQTKHPDILHSYMRNQIVKCSVLLKT